MIAAAILATAIAGGGHGVTATPGMTYSQAAAESGVSVGAVEAANPWPARDIPVGVTIEVPGGKSATVTAAPVSAGKAYGVSYGDPNYCGDGDGDGWDVNCATRTAPVASAPATAYVPQHAAPAEAPPATSYVPRHAAAPAGSPAGIPGWAGCIVARESGGNASAVNASSGAGGLFQFLPSTWSGLGYSGSPQNAPVSEQIAAANQLHAQSGLSPWAADGCPGT